MARPENPVPHLSAYSLAKLVERDDFRSLEPALRQSLKGVAEANWTLAKVTAMETGQLEKQLRAYGVGFALDVVKNEVVYPLSG